MARLFPLILLLLAGCGSEALGPTAQRPGSGAGSGTGEAEGGASALVGTWRTVIIIQVPGDLQTWTTVWQFNGDGSCHQTVVSESLAEGFPRRTDFDCTWSATEALLMIAFPGGGTVTLHYSFPFLTDDRLVLDGFEYHRVA